MPSKKTKVVKKAPIETSNAPDVYIDDQGQEYTRKEWEIAADIILNTLTKHPYVDVLSKKAIANFYISTNGDESNILLLCDDIRDGFVQDAETFYSRLINTFQLVVDRFESKLSEQTYLSKLVYGCKHLAAYCRWLCLEHLPIPPNTNQPPSTTNTLKITEYYQQQLRKEREKILDDANIEVILTLCKKLIKDMERCKNKAEEIRLSYFSYPVDDKSLSDYSIYVRKPMDLKTIKAKLEAVSSGGSGSSGGTSSSSSSKISKGSSISSSSNKYHSGGELISDLRRVFENAIKYNQVHLTTDVSGISKKIYDAAHILQKKLESLLPPFTLLAAEKIESTNYERDVQEKEYLKKRVQEETLERDVKEFEKIELEKLKAEDHIYAHDLDITAKKKEFRQQYQLSTLLENSQVYSMSASISSGTSSSAVGGIGTGVLPTVASAVLLTAEEPEELIQEEEGGAVVLPIVPEREQLDMYVPSSVSKRFIKLYPHKKQLYTQSLSYFQKSCGITSYDTIIAKEIQKSTQTKGHHKHHSSSSSSSSATNSVTTSHRSKTMSSKSAVSSVHVVHGTEPDILIQNTYIIISGDDKTLDRSSVTQPQPSQVIKKVPISTFTEIDIHISNNDIKDNTEQSTSLSDVSHITDKNHTNATESNTTTTTTTTTTKSPVTFHLSHSSISNTVTSNNLNRQFIVDKKRKINVNSKKGMISNRLMSTCSSYFHVVENDDNDNDLDTIMNE